jgi:hypothetical protein
MSHALLHGLLMSYLYHGRAVCVDAGSAVSGCGDALLVVPCVDKNASW